MIMFPWRKKSFGASGSPLLDNTSLLGVPIAAWSVRKLRSSFSGKKIIRIRRTTDNQELDVYLNDNIINGTIIDSFAAGGDARVVLLADQMENGYDLSQATANVQPIFRSNAQSLISGSNSKPVPTLDVDTCEMLTSKNSVLTGTGGWTVCIVVCYKSITGIGWDAALSWGIGSPNYSGAMLSMYLLSNTQQSVSFVGGSGQYYDATPIQTNLNSAVWTRSTGGNSATGNIVYLNNTVKDLTSFDPRTVNIGSAPFSMGAAVWGGSNWMKGYISECIVWNSVLSSSQVDSVYKSQNSFFGCG